MNSSTRSLYKHFYGLDIRIDIICSGTHSKSIEETISLLSVPARKNFIIHFLICNLSDWELNNNSIIHKVTDFLHFKTSSLVSLGNVHI